MKRLLFSLIFLVFFCSYLTPQTGGLTQEGSESSSTSSGDENLSHWSSDLLPSEYPPGYDPSNPGGSGGSGGGGSGGGGSGGGGGGDDDPPASGGDDPPAEGDPPGGSGDDDPSGDGSSELTDKLGDTKTAAEVETAVRQILAKLSAITSKKAPNSTLVTKIIESKKTTPESNFLAALNIDAIKKSLSSTQTQLEEIRKKLSEKAGDPVYVTTGQYYDSSTDLTIRYLITNFEITRTYSQDSVQDGSFGKNWISSLDSRLIFGIDPITENDCNAFYDSEIRPLQIAIDELIRTYTTEFEKGSDEWAYIAPEINDSLTELYVISEELQNQMIAVSELKEHNRGTPVFTRATNLAKDLEDMAETLDTLTTEYSGYKEVCDSYDSLIREYSSLLDEAKQSYAALISKVENNALITRNNQPALLPGTDSYYRTTGLETITLLDEAGVPCSFSSTASPALKGAPSASEGTVWTTDRNAAYKALTKTAEGYLLSMTDGSRRSFSQEGLLLSCSDAYGNFIRFSRDSTGKVTEISTSCGTGYSLSYDGRHITSISRRGSGKPVVQYSYAGDRLSSVTDIDGDTLHYTWADGRITAMVKSDGSSITFSYDAVNSEGQALTTATVNEEGFSEQYVYDQSRRMTEHTDHAGVKTLYLYDSSYRTTQTVYADGLVVSRMYDSNGNMTAEDRNGSTTYYYYDDSDRMTQVRYPDGTHESWSYDNRGNIVSYTGTDGITYEYTRNNEGNIRFCKANGIMLYSCTYSPTGLCTAETVYVEGEPVTATFTYDGRGNLIKAVTGNKTEEWTWDEADNATSYKVGGKTYLTFESEGRTKTVTAYNGLVTKATSNERKDIVRIDELDTVTGERRVSEFEYDRRHLVTASYKGDGTDSTLTGRWRYDGEGRTFAVISYRNGAAAVELYDYVSDRGVRLSDPVSIAYFTLSPETVAQYELRSKAGFERADLNLLSRTAPDCIMRTSDDLKALSADETTGSGTAGQTKSLLSFEYSDDRRLLTVTEGGMYPRQYELNGWEEPVSMTDGNGNTTYFSYDCFGNIISSRDPYGNTTFFEYDEARQQTAIIYADGSRQSFSYNAAGNLTRVTDNAGIVLTQEFDDRGNLSRKSGRMLVETSYSYDNQNRLTRVYEAGTLVRQYEYPENTQVTELSPQTNITTDDAGNITEAFDDASHLVYEYDAGNRLIRQKNIVTGNELTFEYDRAGNRTIMTDGSRTIMYEYGRNNELTGLTECEGGIITSRVSLSYDCLGRETGRTYGNGVSQATTYDDAGNVRLIAQRDMHGVLIWGEGFMYDGNGRIAARVCSDGSISLMNYDQRGRLTSILEADEPARSDNNAEAVYLTPDVYYGLQSLLNSMQMTLGNTLTVLQSMRRTEYEYDTASNRIAEKTGSGTIRYEYDNSNRVIRSGDTSYSYDEEGNILCETGPENVIQYEYSEENRLIRSLVTDRNGDVMLLKTYGYDTFGRRISEKDYVENNGIFSVSDSLNYEYDGFSFAITGIYR